MKRKLSDSESKEQPRKREKLADVVIPTIQERVMENDDITGIIGSFLESKDKTAYCQTARINLADGPFVHPSKVDMSFCALTGCHLSVDTKVELFFCMTHLCTTLRGQVLETGEPVIRFSPRSRHLKSTVVDVGSTKITWVNTPGMTHSFTAFTPAGFRNIWDCFTAFMYGPDDDHRLWTENLQQLCSPLIRRFIKNRRRFKPGEKIELGPSSTLFQLEYDQLGLIQREDSN